MSLAFGSFLFGWIGCYFVGMSLAIGIHCQGLASNSLAGAVSSVGLPSKWTVPNANSVGLVKSSLCPILLGSL